MLNHKFGVELEFITPREISYRAFSSALKQFGKNNSINFINHDKDYEGDVWNIHTDGSINYPYTCEGVEVSSAVLIGNDGLTKVKTFVDFLKDFGCFVNSSCGLHVHVNTKKLNKAQRFAVVARYAHLESKIDKFVDESRRESNNRFCRTIILDEDFIQHCLETSEPNDYHKVDMRKQYPTLEFRHHEATLGSEKVVDWIQFCVEFKRQSVKLFNRHQATFVDNKIEFYQDFLGQFPLFEGFPESLKQKFSKYLPENA